MLEIAAEGVADDGRQLEEVAGYPTPDDQGWLVIAPGCSRAFDDTTGCADRQTFAYTVSSEGELSNLGPIAGGDRGVVSIVGFADPSTAVLRFATNDIPDVPQTAADTARGVYEERFASFNTGTGELLPIAWDAPDLLFRTTTTSPRTASTDAQRKACAASGHIYIVDSQPMDGQPQRTFTVVPVNDPSGSISTPLELPEGVDLGRVLCKRSQVFVVVGSANPGRLSVFPVDSAGVLGVPQHLDHSGTIYESSGHETALYELDSLGTTDGGSRRIAAFVDGRWVDIKPVEGLYNSYWLTDSGESLLASTVDGYRLVVR